MSYVFNYFLIWLFLFIRTNIIVFLLKNLGTSTVWVKMIMFVLLKWLILKEVGKLACTTTLNKNVGCFLFCKCFLNCKFLLSAFFILNSKNKNSFIN